MTPGITRPTRPAPGRRGGLGCRQAQQPRPAFRDPCSLHPIHPAAGQLRPITAGRGNGAGRPYRDDVARCGDGGVDLFPAHPVGRPAHTRHPGRGEGRAMAGADLFRRDVGSGRGADGNACVVLHLCDHWVLPCRPAPPQVADGGRCGRYLAPGQRPGHWLPGPPAGEFGALRNHLRRADRHHLRGDHRRGVAAAAQRAAAVGRGRPGGGSRGERRPPRSTDEPGA